MVEGMIGRKLGMSQMFLEDGTVTVVTVLEAGPCVVVQRKTADRDGYEAVQLGLVDAKSARQATRPLRGHHEKAGVPPTRILREFPVAPGADPKPGDRVVVDVFRGGDRVDVIGTSKGKGFQGVMRRHHFRGGASSHGSMFHRAPGSIGASAFPSRVFPGMRAAGHMGARRVTVKHLRVVRVDADRNILVVKGAVPGPTGSLVLIRKSKPAAAKAAASA